MRQRSLLPLLVVLKMLRYQAAALVAASIIGGGPWTFSADAATWLHRILVNCAMDLLRAARTRPDRRYPAPLSEVSGIAAAPSPNPERLAASAEVGARIAAALEELKPVERMAFTLRHFEGRSIDDIARTLGIRSNAAKQHVFRAIRKLRAELDEQRG